MTITKERLAFLLDGRARCNDCAFTIGTEASRYPSTVVISHMRAMTGDLFECHINPGSCVGWVQAVAERQMMGALLKAGDPGFETARRLSLRNSVNAGQASFVESETLPVQMSPESMAVLEKCGCEFLGPVKDDPHFQYVKMPPGWAKRSTDHALHSDLLDDKGRKRGDICYEEVYLNLSRRFSVRENYELRNEGTCVVEIFDLNVLIHATEAVKTPLDLPEHIFFRRERERAEAWLAERYPDWQNPAAYWNDK